MAWAAPARDDGGRTPRRNRPCPRTATGTVAGMSPWGDLDVETPNLGKKVGVGPSDMGSMKDLSIERGNRLRFDHHTWRKRGGLS